MTNDDKHVLYGGPDLAPLDPSAKSFGEVILKKLKENSSAVLFVSREIVQDKLGI